METKYVVMLVAILATVVMQVRAEVDFDGELTAEEEATFDAMLEPVMKIYEFVQYAATAIGALMLVFAGIRFALSQGDLTEKEKAKQMAFGVVVGLILVWVAPLIVEYLLS